MPDDQISRARVGVDLSKPLLSQVAALGADYDTWVHKSVSPRGAAKANEALQAAGDKVATRWPESLRIFRSAWLESLTHIYWWIIPLVWLPIVALLYVASVQWADLPAAHAWRWALLGVFLWTLTEYCLHRFLFHMQVSSAFGRQFHFLLHGIHHLDPWDRTRLVFPPPAGVLLALPVFGLLWLALPLAAALATMSGLLTGYIIYDLTHYATHHDRPRTRVGKFLKIWHLAHHHKWPTRLYGITSPFWDLVFRTGRPSV
jgi:dihydroceramide fatty acyl 2-hydroxylase